MSFVSNAGWRQGLFPDPPASLVCGAVVSLDLFLGLACNKYNICYNLLIWAHFKGTICFIQLCLIVKSPKIQFPLENQLFHFRKEEVYFPSNLQFDWLGYRVISLFGFHVDRYLYWKLILLCFLLPIVIRWRRGGIELKLWIWGLGSAGRKLLFLWTLNGSCSIIHLSWRFCKKHKEVREKTWDKPQKHCHFFIGKITLA